MPIFRLILLCLIAVSELITVSAAVDAHSLSDSPIPALALLGQSGWLSRVGFVFIAILGFLNRQHIKTSVPTFWQLRAKNSLLWLAGHILFIGVFGLLSFVLFIDKNAIIVSPEQNFAAIGLLIPWLVTGLASLCCLLLVFWPWPAWRLFFFRQPWQNTRLALFATVLSWTIAGLSESSWPHLSGWTYSLSKALLSLIYNGVVADAVTKALGTPHFIVEIRPECSGYEGMGLISIFFSLFIWTARKNLRFPTAFLLYPMGIILMYAFNIIRICLLIIIGTEWSPEIALGGFHANAGWISFITISVFIVWLAQRLPVFTSPELLANAKGQASNPATALLLPFIVLMGATLVGGTASSGFDWIYPLKVMLSIAVLVFFRHAYRNTFKGLSIQAVIIGSAVFGVWIALVPSDAKHDQLFAETLSTVEVSWQYGWLAFRIIGATLTVPFIEEIAFRGYLLPKLINRDFQVVKLGQFTWLSFAVSSLLFGAMHGAWIAGTLAGMGYALALYRRGVVGDAIVAHSVTNTLLAVYVLQTQHWSLW